MIKRIGAPVTYKYNHSLEKSMKTTTVLLLLLSVFIPPLAQSTSERQQFIRVEAPVIALTHVRVIDGTGAALREGQTIIIADGKIQSMGPSTTAKCCPTPR